MRRSEKEVTDFNDIERIIGASDVCRVAFADKDTPYIVTMNFGYSGGMYKKLYFHCAKEGRKIEMLRKNNYVCFEMDTNHKLVTGESACDYGMSYSSVVGWGKISILDEEEQKIEGLNCIMAHYSPYNRFIYKKKNLDRTLILMLEILEITGKEGR